MDYIAIIERVELRLREMKLGKMEFYTQLDISPNSYSLWKKGVNKPTNENLEKMASILGVSLSWLIFGENEKAPTVSREDLELVEKINRLPESDRRYIEGMIDAYLSRR